MAKLVEIQVEIISSETIKPSSPTPSHLKTYTLSLIDQIRHPYHSIMLLFYPKTVDPPHGGELDIDVLKACLSTTLSTYYLFAGRCEDEFTVSCNDKGIPFVETGVNCLLSDFLNSPNKVDQLHKLTPPKEFKTQNVLQELVPLAFQVNVFTCGGVVIGCFKLHKMLLDGTSLVAFLKHWAATVQSTRDGDIVIPVAPSFDAVVSAFPPRGEMGWRPFDIDCDEHKEMLRQYESVHKIAKSFVFTKEAINDLKARASSEEVPRPTRVETLTGFVWEHCMAAAHAVGAMPMGPDPSIMSLVVNMRPKFDPPLTSTSMGNLTTSVSARAREGMELSDLVKEIHASVSTIRDKMESYQGDRDQNVEALVKDIAPLTWYKPGMYVVSSWCQFRLDEVDFGFGKPKWASPTNGIISPCNINVIYFVVDANGDGIEAWVYLEEKEMRILESNKKFLAFASPS